MIFEMTKSVPVLINGNENELKEGSVGQTQ